MVTRTVPLSRPSPDNNVPCLGQYELFDSTSSKAHRAARAICYEQCDFVAWCRNRAKDAKQKAAEVKPKRAKTFGGGPVGTWGGQLIKNRYSE